MKKQILALAAGAALLTAASSSFAGSVGAGDFDYQVTLTGACTVTTGASGIIILGNKNSFAGDIVDAPAGSITIKCSNMAYGVCVNGGTNPLASTSRRLTDGTNYLKYILSTTTGTTTDVGDAGCSAWVAETAAWANPIGGAIVAGVPGATGTGADETINLYADVTIPVDAKPGVYNDNNVTLTVIW